MPVYLELLHGTETTDRSQLDRWGEQGPILGPLAWVHTSYAGDVRCCPLDPDGKPNDYAAADLRVTEECLLYYDGMYYGDWSVTDGGWARKYLKDRSRIRQVDPALALAEPQVVLRTSRDEGDLLGS
jgi:hypothetical protein